MNRVQLVIVLSLILILGLGIGINPGMAQCPPPVPEWEGPDFRVGISVGSVEGTEFTPKNAFELSESLMIIMSLETTEPEIITSAGFIDRDFHLMLSFYDSNCNLITAENLVELTDPPPPLLSNDQQTELVERLPDSSDPPKPPLTIGPFNAHTYYNITEPGQYKVLANVFMRTYSDSDVDINGQVPISLATASGTIVSNTEVIDLYIEWGTGRPVALKMQYTGDDCEATNTSQESSYWSCNDFGNLPSPNSTDIIYITAASKSRLKNKNTDIWLQNYELDLSGSNDTFWIDARVLDEARLAGNTYIWIYDDEGTLLLQTVIFHTSGSEPLNYGDQYGSLKLVGFVSAE